MDSAKKRKLEENGASHPDAENPPSLTIADVRKIIEPFAHEQLIEILQNAVVRHVDVLDDVRSIVDHDSSQRKLFIRGLGYDTNTEKLSNIFSQYGDLEEAIVIMEKSTGKSKGYGFITFKHIDGALLALKNPSKQIDGRMTVTQLAALGNSGPSVNVSGVDVSMRKIYIANVPSDMPSEKLLAHFSSYGEIEEGPLGFDKQTGKSRGFALFVYKTAEAARASLMEPVKMVDGHQILCKLAVDGKRGKPGQPVPGVAGVESRIDGFGTANPLPMQGPLVPHLTAPGLHTGVPNYGGFSGNVPPILTQQNNMLDSSMPASIAPTQSSYASGLSGQYGAPAYGGPIGSGHGILGSGLGSASSGLMGNVGSSAVASSGYGSIGGGFGGAVTGSSLYSRLPSNSGAVSFPGGYPENPQFSLSSSGSGYSIQHNQPSGMSPAPRGLSGGLYHGVPPYS